MVQDKDKFILVVDDMKENRNLLSSYFKKSGRNSITAQSGEESIDIINERNDISLILMDVKMNGMSGVDAMKEIKSRHKVPIIALTAFAMDGDKEDLINKGFDDYVSKPIEFEILNDKINKLL